MHQIAVTILCRLRPPFSLRGAGAFPVPKTPSSVGSPTVEKADAKWWTSIRCMFDSL